MKKHLFLAVSLTLAFGCSPAADNNTTGGTGGRGGSGGSTGGRGGSSGTGGSTGGPAGGSNASGGSGGSGGATGGTGGSTRGTGSSGGSGGSTGGTGGSTGGTGGSTGGTGGGMTDAKPSDMGGGAETGGPAPTGPGASMHNQVFAVPCANQGGMAAGCTLPDSVKEWKKEFQFGGDPNTMYMIRFKFCGVFEGRSYTGCQGTGETPNICLNGTLVNTPSYQATYPTVAFKPDAMRTYYLNAPWKSDDISRFEYSATFTVKGRSTVSFDSDGGDTLSGIYTAYRNNRRYICPDVPGIMQPYVGQFWHVKVESVTPMQ